MKKLTVILWGIVIIAVLIILFSSFGGKDVEIDPADDYYLNNGLTELGYDLIKESDSDNWHLKVYTKGDDKFSIITGDDYLSDELYFDQYNKTMINNVDGFYSHDDNYGDYKFIHQLDNDSYVCFDSKDSNVLNEVIKDYW